MILQIIIPVILQKVFGAISAFLLFAACVAYIFSLFSKQEPRIQPRPLSWLGWALLMGVSVYSQIVSKGFEWSQMPVIISVIGCGLIFIISLKWGIVKRLDIICAFLGIGCLCVYLVTKDPWITTGFAIGADLFVGIPTFENAYKKPEAERSFAWWLGLCAYAPALINCIGISLVYLAFPLYLFLFNGALVYLTYFRKTKPSS